MGKDVVNIKKYNILIFDQTQQGKHLFIFQQGLTLFIGKAALKIHKENIIIEKKCSGVLRGKTMIDELIYTPKYDKQYSLKIMVERY